MNAQTNRIRNIKEYWIFNCFQLSECITQHNTLDSIHNFQWMRTRFVYSLDAHHMMTMTNATIDHKMWVNDLPKFSIKTHHTKCSRFDVECWKPQTKANIESPTSCSYSRNDLHGNLLFSSFGGGSFTMRRSRSVVHRMPYVVLTSYNVIRHPSPECKNIYQIVWFKASRVRDWTIREVKSSRRKIELRNWFLTF